MKVNTDLSLSWILSSIGLVIAFVIGLWQYIKGQRQVKSSLIVSLISEFETDEKLQAGCRLIDYDGGKFSVRGQEHEFKNIDLLEAMKIVEMDEDWPLLHETIRGILDKYFDFFGKLYSLVDINLLRFKDLIYFYYYFELLVNIYKYKGKDFEPALNKYLDAYHFIGCKKCLSEYRKLPAEQRVELELAATGTPKKLEP
ncbi:MAG: hypothetical protein HZB33_07060 [Nitrospirae bacterium]|nr:hypothetical protein [Nitrospirota bacterium]